MSKQTEALKLALEALEYIHEGANNQGPHTGISWRCVSNKAEPAITAIREALADSALDRMAENARELGLDYEPPCKTGSQCTNKCQQCEHPAQEPVAWMYQCSADSSGPVFMQHKRDWAESGSGLWTEKPLYTSPPASKPWVGLSTSELDEIDAPIRERGSATIAEIYRAIEAKLREKNARKENT